MKTPASRRNLRRVMKAGAGMTDKGFTMVFQQRSEKERSSRRRKRRGGGRPVAWRVRI